ncbi:DUF4190 domain-containing protein [Actinoplanes awajinensis]|uniref:DUF4190 domain-containing protein n=1 Tax=Actinoplanes awajinensis subsp. mycoplanecinus TaxID=135947 RepID=A0A101JEC2_9ACTN|nr:DUF4190 domain-containing protein [Actinoplanes awajinensis]KUL25309.1 hypothetical protein ADL15_41035 [Actinoplanes awajinensis subsp. mycoplanecinus]
MYQGATGLEPGEGPATPVGRPPVEWDPDLTGGPRDDLSGLAVASLIFGLIGGFIFSPLLGAAALVKIKQTGQRGKGLAVAGLVLSGVWAVVLAVVVGVNWYVTHRAEDMVALRIGQCLDFPAQGRDDPFVPGQIATLPCTGPHRAEMAGWVGFGDGRGNVGEYPGAAALVQRAQEGCLSVTRNYVLDPLSLPADVHARWYVPRDSEWSRGSHSITCFLAADQAPISRSLREDAAIVNTDQLHFLLAIRDCVQLTARVDALLTAGPPAELRSAVAQTVDACSAMGVKVDTQPWPSEAEPAMLQLVADLDAALPLWQSAAGATSDNDLRHRVEQAQQRHVPTHMLAVRRALKLSTTQGEPLPEQ